MKKNTVGYFIEGLKIVRDFQKFFFISLLFTLLLALTKSGELFLGIVVGILGIFVSYYSIGYGVSIPLFLHDTEKGKPLDASRIYKVTRENAHRLFVIMVIYAFFMLGGVGIVSMFLGLGFLQNGTVSLMSLRTFGWIMVAMSAVGSFFPIAFTLEKKGIIASVRRSISLCKVFPAFFVFVLIVQVTHALIASFLPLGSIWIHVMYFIGWFINSWIIATTYAFWRDQLPPFKHV